MSSACLYHYNPSALCSLYNMPLKTGTIFQLEVRKSGQSKDSGSYIRVCVSQAQSHYVNDELIPCSASHTVPVFSGKRVRLVDGDCELLQVTVVSDGLVINRCNKLRMEKLPCQISAGSTLWFELHKASIRAWQLSDYDIPIVTDNQTGHVSTNEEPFPREPRLPPVCCRRTRTDTLLDDTRYQEGANKEAYCGETASAVGDMTIDVFTNNYASYVSPDSLGACHEGAVDPGYIPQMRQCDLLSDLHVDTNLLNSIGPDLITMSSIESNVYSRIGDPNSLQPIHVNADGKETIYEKPDRIWFHNKNTLGQLGSDLTFKDKSENICSPKETRSHMALLSQSPETTVLPSPNAETSSQSCSESGGILEISDHMLKFNARAHFDKNKDDSNDEIHSHWLDVYDCKTIQTNDSPANLQLFQGPQCGTNNNTINIFAGNISLCGIKSNNAMVSHSAHKHDISPSLPRDKTVSSNSDPAMFSCEVNTRASARNKTKCSQLSSSFRRRCIYMPKKPQVPPRKTTATNTPVTATLGNNLPYVAGFHANDSVTLIKSEDRLNTTELSYHKCNSTTSGKHDISHYLASLKLRVPSGKNRSISNASEQVMKPAIRHSRSFSFFSSKDKTHFVGIRTRPLSPAITH